jgi:hypothetical protein
MTSSALLKNSFDQKKSLRLCTTGISRYVWKIKPGKEWVGHVKIITTIGLGMEWGAELIC